MCGDEVDHGDPPECGRCGRVYGQHVEGCPAVEQPVDYCGIVVTDDPMVTSVPDIIDRQVWPDV